MNFNKQIFVVIVLIMVQLQALCRSAPTAASDRYPNYLRSTDLKINNLCDKKPDHREMCEKCAKVSRNQFVFGLCCANSDEVGDWCDKYINYTID